jgi:hypothetical protein
LSCEFHISRNYAALRWGVCHKVRGFDRRVHRIVCGTDELNWGLPEFTGRTDSQGRIVEYF